MVIASGPCIVVLPVVVALPFMVNPAKAGVDVVIKFWLMLELPNSDSVYPPPLMVILLIVELAMVEVEMEFAPVSVVLPPWMERVLEAVPPEML